MKDVGMSENIPQNLFSPLINLPSKFILTESGETYFINRGIPLRDIFTSDGKKTAGFVWQNFKTKLIEKFIVGKLIDEIDFERFEFDSKSEELIDMCKLVLYSVFFKKFKPEMSSLLYNSEVFEKIKKDNPQIKINSAFKFNPTVVNKYLSENKDAFSALKEILSIDAIAIIENDEQIEDKERKKTTIHHFIEQIEPDMWFLFYFLSKSGNAFELMKQINELLIVYLMKTKIIDLIAFFVVDLLKNAERAHYSRISKMRNFGKPGMNDIDLLLKDESIKSKMTHFAMKINSHIQLVFKFSEQEDAISKRVKKIRIQISIMNKGDITHIIRKDSGKKIVNRVDKLLTKVQTMKETTDKPEEEQKLDGEPPIIQSMKNIERICEKEKIKFVNSFEFNDRKEESMTYVTILI